MQQTEHYQLNQWEKNDLILMEDFNDNNQKIEAALEGVTALCNCQVYVLPYTGTGEKGPKTFTFPHRPMFLCIQSLSSWVPGVRGLTRGQGLLVVNSALEPALAWGDKSVSVGTAEDSAPFCCNSNGSKYCLLALLDAND